MTYFGLYMSIKLILLIYYSESISPHPPHNVGPSPHETILNKNPTPRGGTHGGTSPTTNTGRGEYIFGPPTRGGR